jgi:hypothetical protein
VIATETKTEDCERCGKEQDWNDTYSCCYCGVTVGECCGTGFACNKCEEAAGDDEGNS